MLFACNFYLHPMFSFDEKLELVLKIKIQYSEVESNPL